MKSEPDIRWEFLSFAELDAPRLYGLLKARTEVFVVEQNCVYQDMDDIDLKSHHLTGWSGTTVAGYLRVVPPGVKYAEPSIGRVITTSNFRKTGLGRELMKRGIEHAQRLYPSFGNRISAQAYLEKFYQSLGFSTISEPYDEDGLPHIEMLLAARG